MQEAQQVWDDWQKMAETMTPEELEDKDSPMDPKDLGRDPLELFHEQNKLDGGELQELARADDEADQVEDMQVDQVDQGGRAEAMRRRSAAPFRH